MSLSEKGSDLKEKNLLPYGANSFLLEQTPFQKGVALMAQLNTHQTGNQEIAIWPHSFIEIDHEIFFTVSPSLPLIQEGQLSVSDESMSVSTG